MQKKGTVLRGIVLVLVLCCLALTIGARLGLFSGAVLTITANGEVTELDVQRGQVADVSQFEAAPAGYRFVCWLDANGNEADLTQPVEGDASYTALIAPALAASMTPWLEYDELGRLLPNQPVSGAELAAGVSALFEGAVEADSLASLGEVTETDLAAALEGLFSPGTLAALDGTEPLTRAAAAELILSLAGIQPAAPERAPAPDLAADAPGAAALAACADPAGAVSYEPGNVYIDGYLYLVDENGLFVTDAEVDGLYYDENGRCASYDFEPGFVNLGGYLYYVDEDGRFAQDTEIGGIYFGSDGRYTSGSEELDALVAEVLAPICEENETREEMLRAAFNYVRDSFEYLRRNYYAVGETGWEVEEATTMFSTGRGNCYNYAAAFWALARGLGYDATAVSGTMGWDYEPHGWVTIYDENGALLTYDTETEMAYRRDGDYSKDMFAMSYWYAAGWNYYYGA